MQMQLDREAGVLVIEPVAPLSQADLAELSGLLDPYLEKAGRLKGLMIDTRALPGWHGLASMLAHKDFIRIHAGRIDRVAFVTDSDVASIVAKLIDFALPPAARRFHWDERSAALAWLRGDAKR